MGNCCQTIPKEQSSNGIETIHLNQINDSDIDTTTEESTDTADIRKIHRNHTLSAILMAEFSVSPIPNKNNLNTMNFIVSPITNINYFVTNAQKEVSHTSISQSSISFNDNTFTSLDSDSYEPHHTIIDHRLNDKDHIEFMIIGYLRIYQFTNRFVATEIITLIYNFYHYKFNSIKLFEHNTTYQGQEEFKPFQSSLNNCTKFLCSSHSFFFITNQNKLYVKGGNNVGNLGLGHQKGTFEQTSWTKHWFFNGENAVKYISGPMISSHHFIKTIKNELYAIGNNDIGQCGVKVTDYQANHTTDACIVVPVLIKPSNFKGQVVQVSSGYNHSVFLTKCGYVHQCGFTCGGNFDPDADLHKIVIVESLKEIIQIDCSYAASYALNKDGKLFSWGNGRQGQLGIGMSDIKSSSTPMQILETEFIQMFCAGHSHVGYITAKGDLYMFGRNDDGECGVYDNEYDEGDKGYSLDCVFVPTHVLKTQTVTQVQCGCFKTIAKTMNGEYYRLHTKGLGYDSGRKSPELLDMQAIKTHIEKYFDSDELNRILDIDIEVNNEGEFVVCFLE